MIQIAILGFGTVGSGVYEVIQKNGGEYCKKLGQEIRVKRILDIRDFPELPYADLFTKDYNEILNDPDITVVVEVMGGLHPAYEYTRQALLAGKHAVTSNKELVAQYGAELLAIAREKGVSYMFEASVGGGIPIIRPLNSCLAANRIAGITGILNGTTNYILTQMIQENQTFEDALRDAQQKGYAERNPAADVEGHDACRKIAILSSLVYGRQVDSEQIHTEGITHIKLEDVAYASRIGCVIKLLAHSTQRDGKVYARVCPMLIGCENQLSNVEDVFNAVLVEGDAVGDVLFYGRGAGKLPTASAVVADVLDIVRNPGRGGVFYWEAAEDGCLGDFREMPVSYYIRIRVSDRDRAMEQANALFGKCEFILLEGSPKDELAFVTPCGQDGALMDRIEQLREHAEVLAAIRKMN